MKYKISLVLIFSCIIAFGGDKKVRGLEFSFYLVDDLILLEKEITKSQKEELVKKTPKSRKIIIYEIFFGNKESKKGSIKGNFASLVCEEEIINILYDILNIFDKKEYQDTRKILQQKNESEEEIKKIYIEENKEKWKQEYEESLKTESMVHNKKSEGAMEKRLKDSGLLLLGSGLGIVFDRYVLKK